MSKVVKNVQYNVYLEELTYEQHLEGYEYPRIKNRKSKKTKRPGSSPTTAWN